MNIRLSIFPSLIFLFISTISFSQVIRGIVLDKDNKPISYVSIGIVNGNQGTISDDRGNFRLDLTNIERSETLRFSCVGFFSKDFKISSIGNGELKVILDEQSYQIEEILIHPAKNTIIEFGKKKMHRNGFLFHGMGDGIELARLFTNTKNILLNKFKFCIKSTEYDSILFRLNIYSNKDGMPGDNINQSQIFIKSNQNGWVEKDLTANDIIINQDFFISLEPIKGWRESKEKVALILLSGTVGKDFTFARRKSQSGWDIINGPLDYYILAQEE